MPAQARRAASVSQRVKEHWHEFTRSRPGRRFQDRYKRRRSEGHSLVAKAFSLTAGVALFLLGLVLLPAPGPGFLVVFIGAGMIAEESFVAAKALDWTEVRLRRIAARLTKRWIATSLMSKMLIVLTGLAILAALGFAAWVVLFGS